MSDIVISEIVIPNVGLFGIFFTFFLLLMLILVVSNRWDKITPHATEANIFFWGVGILAAMLFLPAVYQLLQILWQPQANGLLEGDSKGYAVLLAAIVGAPLVVWRTVVAHMQSNTAAQGLITDRINKAVEQLGAEKTVWEDDKQSSKPNLEVRLGGIYALERIAQDSERDHISVMEILCAYIRENNPASESIFSPHEVFDYLSKSTADRHGLNPHQIFENEWYQAANSFEWDPTQLSHHNLKIWAESIPRINVDIQAVLSVIGRRRLSSILVEEKQSFSLDLSDSNLQKAVLVGNFNRCNFSNSRMDRAELKGLFNDVSAVHTSCQSLQAGEIEAVGIDFTDSKLSCAFFGSAQMSRARFWLASMQYTNFNGATLIGSDWFNATVRNVYTYQETDLTWSRFQRTNLEEFKGLFEGNSQNLFIDGSVKMSETLETRFPRHTNHEESELEFRSAWLAAKKKQVYPKPNSLHNADQINP